MSLLLVMLSSLLPAPIISGRVLDAAGRPLEGVVISARTFGDSDSDGDVDLADFAVFQCVYGAPCGVGDWLDVNQNGGIDLADFRMLRSQLRGPAVATTIKKAG